MLGLHLDNILLVHNEAKKNTILELQKLTVELIKEVFN